MTLISKLSRAHVRILAALLAVSAATQACQVPHIPVNAGVHPSSLSTQPSLRTHNFRTARVASGPSRLVVDCGKRVLFTESRDPGNAIGEIGPAQRLVEHKMPARHILPGAIECGTDARVWFTEVARNAIGSLDRSGRYFEYRYPLGGITGQHGADGLTRGVDGNLWFFDYTANRVVRMTPSGSATIYAAPLPHNGPAMQALGHDGAVWFTSVIGVLGRVTSSGAITYIVVAPPGVQLTGIAAAGDGSIWVSEATLDRLVRVTSDYSQHVISLPKYSMPGPIAIARDGTAWVAENGTGKLAQILVSGKVREYDVFSLHAGVTDLKIARDGGLWFTQTYLDTVTRLDISRLNSRESFDRP